jgi:hypothetical protein
MTRNITLFMGGAKLVCASAAGTYYKDVASLVASHRIASPKTSGTFAREAYFKELVGSDPFLSFVAMDSGHRRSVCIVGISKKYCNHLISID